MDAPPSLEFRSGPSLLARGAQALVALETVSKLALFCVAMGWFFLDTLVASLGSLQHGVRFFDMSAVIADPTRMFFGVDAPWHRAFFGALCSACLLAPLQPHMGQRRRLWVCYELPLALMLLCGVLLSIRTSGDFFASVNDPNTVSGSLMHFANTLIRRGGDVLARHISVGAGAYLAAVGAAVLASQGLRRWRR